MDINTQLLHALDGIRQELQTLNRTLSGMTSQQSRPTPRPSSRPASRPSSPMSSPRSAAPARTGGYKRKSEDGELTGYGAEMASRFPQKRGPVKPKGKPPAKKGNGFPKKSK